MMFRLYICVCLLALLYSVIAQKRGKFFLLDKKIENVEETLSDEIKDLVAEMTTLYARLEEANNLLEDHVNKTEQYSGHNFPRVEGVDGTSFTPGLTRTIQEQSDEIRHLKTALQEETESRTSLHLQLTAMRQEFNERLNNYDRTINLFSQAFRAEKYARKRLHSDVLKRIEDIESDKGLLGSAAKKLSNLTASVLQLEDGIVSQELQMGELVVTVTEDTESITRLEDDTQHLIVLVQSVENSVSALSTLGTTLNTTVAGLLVAINETKATEGHVTTTEVSSSELQFTVTPLSVKLEKGSTHYSECRANDEDAQYTWLFNGDSVPEYNGSAGFGYRDGGLMEISSFSEDYEGWFTCRAKIDTRSAEYTFRLQLVDVCAVRVTQPPGRHKVRVGNKIAIPCGTVGAKTVTWIKDNKTIDFSDQSRLRKLTNNYLLVDNAEMTDAGRYQCQAESETGCSIRREGELSVVNVVQTSRICGRSAWTISGRISRGMDVEPGDSPWHVLLMSNVPGARPGSLCGGSLISQKWVVTTASCITDFSRTYGGASFNQENVRLVLGTNLCLNHTGAVSRTPVRVIKHPDFSVLAEYDSDIALLELDSPVQYTDYVRPICVEPDTFNQAFLFKPTVMAPMAKVVGCGTYSMRSSRRPSTLQQVNLPYVDWDTCNASLTNVMTEEMKMTKNMLCAGYKRGRMGDACGGDGGGSLVMADDDRWVQVGIVSWGIGCDRDSYYGFYTNVGNFYDWIKGHTAFDEEQVEV